jgi:dTDP-4-amino-4,6-dideoxygalactose transaminase
MNERARRIPISQPVLPDVEKLLPELREVFESGQLTNGRHVARLESAVRDYIGRGEVVALSSNTTGLVLAWRALEVSGEVLVPSFTFPATVHALIWNNLQPVLVDCDRETFNIDVADARRKMTSRTVGISPVYIFGNPPEWEAIESLAREAGIRCVADAAHAFGTRVGREVAGTHGDVEIFSLAPTKVFTTGEGGFAVTTDHDLAERLRRMRNYGNPGDYNCREIGLNGRMTEIHALVGLHALPNHEAQLEARQTLAAAYREALGGIPGLDFQRIADGARSTHNYFAIRIEPERFGLTNRRLQDHLRSLGVESKVYFHPPIHRQRLYRGLSDGRALPNTEWLVDRILCLPLTGRLTVEDVTWVAGEIRAAHERAPALRAAPR